MHISLTTFTLFVSAATASYVIEDDYNSDSFAGMFDFFTDDDPTHGYVNYVDYNTASSSGLYKVQNGQVYMGVDSTNTASGRGRNSVRIASKNTYQHGLVILDLAHMPAGACGTWPAFWMLGADWPNNGEIDIIEGVSAQTANNMAVHTSDGCTISNTGGFSGTLETDNCYVGAADQATNAGCSIRSNDDQSFGAGFNSVGGGVFATEWTSEAISIWFFPRGAIPSDISSGSPDPSGWGLPQGQFQGACDIDEKVQNQQIVFDVTFCGDWAGSVWSTDATCSSQASTCQAFVQNNPSAFQDTYWLINSLKVYSDNGASPSQPPASSSLSVSTQQPTGTSSPSYTFPATTTFVTVTSGGVTTYTLPPTTYTLTSAPVETTQQQPTSVPTTAVPPPSGATTVYTTEIVTTAAPTPAPSSDNNNNGGGWSWGGNSGGGNRGGSGGGRWGGSGGGGGDWSGGWGH
ncbi:hypothetical protein PV08_09397 [Exophiala spinifera]|uniref:endo-1,3(4)-beta-glucanase n=1 Tax=Exophiala spinifera TaxID=91928 RepID=A0A0D2AZI7_9EURO|nr:uncharacterized protein PV08_09397 [Exophiala spinifera]KIW12123.1 hypothetical protein PV08_09397 [Exophiala spinifera]